MSDRPLPNNGRLLWIDLEMTGLDLKKDQIIEIAAIVTEKDLTPVDEGKTYIIKTSEEVLQNMNEWCIKQHGKTGLTQACREATQSMQEVEADLLAWVLERMPDRLALLAGSSVHVDKTFLAKDMPKLHDHLHYRILDVSSIKEAVKRFHPDLQYRPENGGVTEEEKPHRALDDIQHSIRELAYCKANVFVQR